MRRHHPKNERIKRRYLAYLEEAKRMAPKSADQAAAAIALFEASTGYRDFGHFHIEQARKFKRRLLEQLNPETGKPLAKATVHSRLMALKAFFHWLAGQTGYKSKISYSDADYFNPSANDSRIATRGVTSQCRASSKSGMWSARCRREQILSGAPAPFAFAILTGARDDAMASMSLRHVDLEKRAVFQDARAVRTKNRKIFTTCFFPVGGDFEAIVANWIAYLTKELLFGPDDPLFPTTRIAVGANGHFGPVGLDRKAWASAGPIRAIFRKAFNSADLPYFNPHTFRNTLARLGEKVCPSPEAFKAWSQNLGHEHVLTTFTSYGAVASHRQAEIFADLCCRAAAVVEGAPEPDSATVQRVLEHLRKKAG